MVLDDDWFAHDVHCDSGLSFRDRLNIGISRSPIRRVAVRVVNVDEVTDAHMLSDRHGALGPNAGSSSEDRPFANLNPAAVPEDQEFTQNVGVCANRDGFWIVLVIVDFCAGVHNRRGVYGRLTLHVPDVVGSDQGLESPCQPQQESVEQSPCHLSTHISSPRLKLNGYTFGFAPRSSRFEEGSSTPRATVDRVRWREITVPR